MDNHHRLKPFTAKFSDQTLKQIKSIAEREQRTPGAVIRSLVAAGLLDYQKAKTPTAA